LKGLGLVLLAVGATIAVCGLLLLFVDRIPWLGRLPGDIVIRRERWTFYLPLATMLIVSVVLTLLLNLFGRR
jgi:hypothetical protein